MPKYKVIKEAVAPFDDGEDRGKHYYPGSPHGDTVDLDDNDPRVENWLAVGIIEKTGGRPKKEKEGAD